MLFFNWLDQLGSGLNDYAIDIAVDGNGNVVITGDTRGNLAGTNLVEGIDDAWIALYNKDGNQIWRTQLGTAQKDQSRGVTVDGNGNIYVTGNTAGDLGGTNAGGTDAWFAKYSTTAQNTPQQVWLSQIGDASNEDSKGIALDNQGNIYLTGVQETNGNKNVWVGKYSQQNNNPVETWFNPFGTDLSDLANSIAVDSQGNVYITGSTEGTLGAKNFGGIDAWVAKYDTNGNRLWLEQLGTTGVDESRDVAVDDQGNVYITGYTTGILGGLNQGQWDAWIAKYDSNGELQWTVQPGTPQNDDAYGIAVNSDQGVIYVTGRTLGVLGSVNFGVDDIWLAEYDLDGNRLQDEEGKDLPIVQLGTNVEDISHAVAINGEDVYLAGRTYGTLDKNTPNQGLSDAFVAKYSTVDSGTEPPIPVDKEVKGDLSLPNRSGSPGEIIEIPIRIDNAQGIRGVDITIDFDRTIFEYIAVENGPVVASDWLVTVNETGFPSERYDGVLTSLPKGDLKISFFDNVEDDSPPPIDGGEPLPDFSGVLASVFLKVKSDAPVDVTSKITFVKEEVLINEVTNFGSITDGAIEIVPDLLQVIDFQDNASGFDVTFNRSINLDVLNLYAQRGTYVGLEPDTPDSNFLDPADVIVKDSQGNEIKGSLSWNADENKLTFVKTGTELAAGDYTVTLQSRIGQVTTNPQEDIIKINGGGIITPLGSLLDGDGDTVAGGDFVTNFTVSSDSRILRLPDFARGPSQPVNVPARESAIPITINNIRDLSDVEFTFKYDQDILKVKGVTLAQGLNDWNLGTPDFTTPGEVKISLSGPALKTSGERRLVLLDAEVRPDAEYKASELLKLDDLVLNGGAIAAKGDTAVHQIAFLGDATGGGVYTSADSALMARVGVELDSGFGAFPLIDPNIVGDITGSEGVTSYDAAFLARFIVGENPQPEIPDLPFTETNV